MVRKRNGTPSGARAGFRYIHRCRASRHVDRVDGYLIARVRLTSRQSANDGMGGIVHLRKRLIRWITCEKIVLVRPAAKCEGMRSLCGNYEAVPCVARLSDQRYRVHRFFRGLVLWTEYRAASEEKYEQQYPSTITHRKPSGPDVMLFGCTFVRLALASLAAVFPRFKFNVAHSAAAARQCRDLFPVDNKQNQSMIKVHPPFLRTSPLFASMTMLVPPQVLSL